MALTGTHAASDTGHVADHNLIDAALAGKADVSALAGKLDARGQGTARFIQRAAAGAILKITCLGDSILAGSTVTAGTNDALTLVRNDLSTRYPTATFTTTNRAVSGATVATALVNANVEAALIDKADLYIIGLGRNDVVSDAYAYPVQGYTLNESMRGLEVMIREMRRRVPQADIVVMSENPAAVYATDTALRTWNAAARNVAAAYGCEFVDCYAAFYAMPSNDYSSLMFDTVHPNVAGHRLIADTLLLSLPAVPPKSSVAPGRPSADAGIRAVQDVAHLTGYQGWQVVQATGGQQNGNWINTGTWAGSNPYVTSTAASYAEFRFVGTEFMARLSTSAADALVVDIAIDGATVYTDQSMSAIPSTFQPFVLLAKGLTPATHTVRITLKTGTLRIYQAAWLSAATPQMLVSGRYYGQDPFTPYPDAAGPAGGTAVVVPFFVPSPRAFDQIAVDVLYGVAGTTIALGIYGSDEYDQPAGLELDAGSVSSATAGFAPIALAGFVLQPGWHWLAALPLGGNPGVRVNTTGSPLVTTSSQYTGNVFNGYGAAGLSALPKVWPAFAASMMSPRVMLRAT